MLNKEKIEYFKKQLEEKKARLEKEMEKIAHPNLNAPGDWEVTTPAMDVLPSDPNELSDTFEELENVAAIGESFEEDVDLIAEALERIKKGKYGVCEICGKDIEEKRLEASPTAKSCIEHTKNR